MKKLGVEDKILLGVCVLVLIWLAFVLSGCSAKEAKDAHVLWICPDGGVFHASGLSVATGNEIKSDWLFTNCEVLIDKDIESKSMKE